MAKYVRYQQGGTIRYGELKGDAIQPLLGDFARFSPSPEPAVKLADVKLMSPCSPSKIVAIGPNYKSFFANARQILSRKNDARTGSAINDAAAAI